MKMRFVYILFFSFFLEGLLAQKSLFPERYAFNDIFKKGTEYAVFELVFSCSALEWEEKFDSTVRHKRFEEYVADFETFPSKNDCEERSLQKHIIFYRDICHIEITEGAVLFNLAIEETHPSIIIPVPKYLLEPYAFMTQLKGLHKALPRAYPTD